MEINDLIGLGIMRMEVPLAKMHTWACIGE